SAAVGDPHRSPTLRAERAKLKSRRDDMIVAQGEGSAALGYGPKRNSFFFLPVCPESIRGKPEGKKEVGWGGFSPRAAASAALLLSGCPSGAPKGRTHRFRRHRQATLRLSWLLGPVRLN